MADIRIEKLTLKLSGFNRQESERLARQITEGLAASEVRGTSRKVGGISRRVTAPESGGPDALAEAVVTDLVRSLLRGI